MEIIIGIIGLVLSLAGYSVGELTQLKGNKIRKDLTELANKIYSKIADNQKMLDNLYQAYNERNANLGNALLMQSGFGPATEALRKEMAKNKEDYSDKKDKYTKENVDLTNQYNQTNQAIANAGQGLAANKGAQEVYDQVNQAVNGGLNENG